MNDEVKQEIKNRACNLYAYCVENQMPLVITIGKGKEFLHGAAMWTYEEMVDILMKVVEQTCKGTQIDCVEFCREMANVLESSQGKIEIEVIENVD